VVPEHGRVAGVIRPVGYDDKRGASDLFASAEPWPSGLERVGDLDGEVSCDVSFRAVSSKYPLRVTAASAGVDGRGGLAVARRGEETAVSALGNESDETSASGRAEERTTPPAETNGPERPATTTTTDRPTARSTASSDDDASGVPALGTPDPSDPPRRVEPEKSSSAPATEVAFAGRGFASPPAKLMRSVAKAVSEWQMIVPGDRVMLGLSGGKDSLAMLHILKALQRRYPPGTFSLACCTIDPGTEAFNPRPLIEYCASLGVEYHYREERIMEMASEHMSGDSICAFCARMKRGALYSCMREHGYNKLVLAQHLDDVVESFLMSTMHNGLIRTMKAAYVVDEGDLTVIRPGIYCRERQLRDFSYAAGLPVINENCPACFEAPKERHHIKKLLARERVSSVPVPVSAQRAHAAARPRGDGSAGGDSAIRRAAVQDGQASASSEKRRGAEEAGAQTRKRGSRRTHQAELRTAGRERTRRRDDGRGRRRCFERRRERRLGDGSAGLHGG
jgi:tRNA(Ile)-lysidine synthase TilS/MesJ